ncbi:putative methyltransferase for Ribosomal protein L11 [Prochlorococcus marinus str. MIT 9515]|uniref:Ribosomal protein L11 methyltransferase n=1 Tax=Prochlorococcus marinus (strain MIT 9515) TaxID=167542 RepID=PRMA_PROM5|nr:50S ribosomal protein L11 methyltransferase [Prochlorococcus marinus]A2BY60.1 RecName: Full=Ribosomal protein L11 methyltransferase; Short=L11 Mtase [Prochlorococcus marinus str. MIT 9515]ABM72721.1 putative methyltransferase for Ribosomal protein L11 [Prochlorococcus marinus str. MIT 9515]
MEINYWYKLTFEIEANLEEIIIWKLNELGISSYALEILLNNKNNKKVLIWLPNLNWPKSLRIKLERNIKEVLDKNNYRTNCFEWIVIEQEDWMSSWKKYWGPELVGKKLLVLPCWLELPEKFKNKKVIKIDPGAAFGTGSHPTTSLCLEELEKFSLSNKKILDIGSGSGILSIAARYFGASKVYSIDNDYLAINSTESNFRLNFGDLDDLKTYLGRFDELVSKYSLKNFDLILCNILAEVIKGIIPDIRNCLKINGEVIFSGILNSQKDEIIKLLNASNLQINDVSSKQGWVCITAQKII